MADTQIRDETEPRQSTALDPRERVEVFDTNGAAAHRQAEKLNGGYDSAPTRDDAGFGHADLRKAEVVHGDGDTIAFKSTDLRNSELTSADFTTAQPPNLADNSQGTNWGTILMVIALILVIILIGSWLF